LCFKDSKSNYNLENSIDSEALETFEYYRKGVNDFATNYTLPLQFSVFRISFEEWTLVDSCTIMHLMHFMLSPDWGIEILRDYITAVSDDDNLAQLLLTYDSKYWDNSTIPIINEEEMIANGFFSEKTLKEQSDVRPSNLLQYVKKEVADIADSFKTVSIEGSNAWAVSGKHTKNGKPMICNDPHLGNGIPSIWHYSEIEYVNREFISGATVPGLPFYAIFTTDKIGISFFSNF